MGPDGNATLDEEEIERLAHERDVVIGCREAARRALAFARRYREEDGVAGGAREIACIGQAQVWRRAVRELHAGLAVPWLARASTADSAPFADGPGLARAARSREDGERKTG